MSEYQPIMGKQTYVLDAKNRIFIPAKHREALGSTFVIFPNIRNKRSLIISSVEYYKNFIEQIKGLKDIKSSVRLQMISYLSEEGDTLTPDAQGRVVISASLVALAGLGGQTVIKGCFDHAEIMSAQVYSSADDEAIEGFAQIIDDAELI